jgi:hypothetical protein
MEHIVALVERLVRALADIPGAITALHWVLTAMDMIPPERVVAIAVVGLAAASGVAWIASHWRPAELFSRWASVVWITMVLAIYWLVVSHQRLPPQVLVAGVLPYPLVAWHPRRALGARTWLLLTLSCCALTELWDYVEWRYFWHGRSWLPSAVPMGIFLIAPIAGVIVSIWTRHVTARQDRRTTRRSGQADAGHQ